MPDSEDQIGPDWLWYVGGEFRRLRTLGQQLDEGVVKAVYFWSLCIEIDDMPRPVVSIINRHCARLIWGKGRNTLVLECRASYFTIHATNQGHAQDGRFRNLRWVERSRRAMRWVFPHDAGGSPAGDMLKEIERP